MGAWRVRLSIRMLAHIITAIVLLAAPPAIARDALFTVAGVAVDVTDKDAATAKVKAIQQAQVIAFRRLVKRLAGEAAVKRFSKLTPRDIGRMMASLSIANEQTGPDRYIARLTIRFMPKRVRALLRKAGLAVVTQKAPPVLIVPLWRTADGLVEIWGDNPWRKAWLAAQDEHALQPVIVAAGDETDQQTISAAQALAMDDERLEALKNRYDVQYVLVTVAEPVGEASVRATMSGKAPGDNVALDKTYDGGDGGLEVAAQTAAHRFVDILAMKWRQKVLVRLRKEARARAAERARRAARAWRTVVVAFDSLRQWQAIRARLLSTPGVQAVDVRSLGPDHAVIGLRSNLQLLQLRNALAQSRLDLYQAGGRLVVRAY